MPFFVSVALAAPPPPIVGGEVTTNHPEVMFLMASDGNLAQACTAFLMADVWAMTAAHCVIGTQDAEIRSVFLAGADEIGAVAGFVGTRGWYPSPDYNPSDGRHDYALIELQDPQPGPFLPLWASRPAEADIGTELRLLVFGSTDRRNDPTARRFVDVPLVSYDDAKLHTASGKGGENACVGDSGGAGAARAG